MTLSALHVAFDQVAASNVRRALSRLGRQDAVIRLSDDLSFSPINPPDANLRAEWVKVELRHAGWTASFKGKAAWAAIRQHQGSLVACMSRRSSKEQAGFLEFVGRVGGAPFTFVDLTAAGPHPLSAEEIVAGDLLGEAPAVTADMREHYRMVWQHLQMENAPFRVLDDDLKLSSAPITFFDQQLLSFAKENSWQKAARIIGNAFIAFDEDGRFQTGDIPLIARLQVLAEQGLLESQGDLSRIRYSEVRLPVRTGGRTIVL